MSGIKDLISSLKKKKDEVLNDNQGWFRQGQFTPGRQIETVIPGGFEGAKQRLRQSSWKQYTPMQLGPDAVMGAGIVGTALGNRQAGQDVGYFLKGANNLTPWSMASKQFNKEQEALVTPTTQRQQNAQRLGQMAYGTALTAPIGGPSALTNVTSRLLQGGALGAGVNTVGNVIQGKKITENLSESVLKGMENSWQLAFTNLAADKVARAIPTLRSLTPESMKIGSNLLKSTVATGNREAAKKIFAQNVAKIFQRALLETPIENTWFTALNKLNGDEKREFAEAWLQDIAGTAVGNLVFAGLNVGKQGLIDLNKPQLDEIGQTIANSAQKYLSPRLRAGETRLLTSGVPLKTGTKQPTIKIRGFTESVQETPKVTPGTKVKVTGEYTIKPTDELMGEAKALLTEGASLKNIDKIQNIDAKITATIQQAINLDKAGKHQEAAALFNNLSETGTELGRGVHAFNLLNQMSPEAISLSAAGRINKYNETARVKIPKLTADQQKMISDSVKRIQSITDERIKNIELNKLQEKISEFIPSSLADKLVTTWKAGLLTSPRTAGRNIIGNTIMQGGEMASSKLATIPDWLMSQTTGQRTTTGSLQGTLSGARTGISSAVDVMKYGFDPNETIAKFDIKKVTWGNNPVEQALKKYTNFVFNSLSAQDKPFWQSSYARSLYDQAAAQALNQGQKGNQKIIQDLFNNATEQMKAIATNDANYATFKDKNMISNIAAGFKRAAGQKEWSKLPAEIVAPFTGVPSSIVGKTIDYSPLGLMKGIKDAGKVMTQDIPDLQRKAAQEIGRGTVGTAIFALGSYLMSKGLITGQPKDDKERKQWELEGRQQNSILLNGKWRSINSVGPQTLILLAGAKFDEEMNDPEGSMAKYGLTLIQDQLGQTFLAGVQQPLQAITDPNRYGKSYAGGQVASLIPNIIKDTSKALDSTMRETDTGSFMGNIKTSVQSGVPVWRNQMTPRRDVLGNVIKQEPTGLGAYIDLFNSKTPISNNVVDELSRLNAAGYNATPSKLSSTQTIKGVKGKLTQQELDVLETKTGVAVSKGLDNLFKSSSYQKLDDEEKQKAIGDLVTKTRKQVRGTIDLTVMPDLGYTTSADSPKGLGKLSLYGTSLVTDPGQTIKAVLDGNPIRKVVGGAVILERKNALGTLDAGDKTTEVDHIIPLSHGGTNDKENLQKLTVAEHKIKTQINNYWLKEFEAGNITKKELQEKDKNWRNEVDSLPKTTQESLVTELSNDTTGTGKIYQIINEETGSISTIDLSKPIEAPKYTGYAELDKKLKSAYKSAISTRISNITKLYKDGQLTAEEANKLIGELKTASSSASGKKITIKATPKMKIIKAKKIPMIKFKIPKAKEIKFKKPKTAKTKLAKLTKIKIKKSVV